MIIKLGPHQIMEYWTYVKECILEALPPQTTEDNLLQVQEQLLTGEMECWLGMKEQTPYAVVVTQILPDQSSGTKNLLIFSLAIIDDHDSLIWTEGYETFSKYARVKECKKILAYSNNSVMIKVAEKLGADTSWRVITFTL